MKKVELNTSISARIKRRNSKNFVGEGTSAWTKSTSFGDYTDEKQNHKDVDYKKASSLKQKLDYAWKHFNHKHLMSKRYADNHQKL